MKDCTLPRTYRGYSYGSRGFQTTDVCGVFLGMCVYMYLEKTWIGFGLLVVLILLCD